MIRFKSDLPPRKVAAALAAVMFDPKYNIPTPTPYPTDGMGYPVPEDEAEKWDLTGHNDHKLIVYGDGQYLFHDRYSISARIERARRVLIQIGATLLT